jgi:hypothetical protein
MHDTLIAVVFVGMFFCPMFVASIQSKNRNKRDEAD